MLYPTSVVSKSQSHSRAADAEPLGHLVPDQVPLDLAALREPGLTFTAGGGPYFARAAGLTFTDRRGPARKWRNVIQPARWRNATRRAETKGATLGPRQFLPSPRVPVFRVLARQIAPCQHVLVPNDKVHHA